MTNDRNEQKEFLDGIAARARYISRSTEKIETHSTLSELFAYPHLTSLVLNYPTSVREILRLLWGVGFPVAQSILIIPDPDSYQLGILTDLLHDHVPYTINIVDVMEAVSYALGNDKLFGEEFTDSRLRDAASIPF